MAARLFERGWTSLHEAAAHPKELRRLEELLKNGAVEVNQRDRFGETPLHVACRSECVAGVKEVVCLLLKNGANVNTRSNLGRTPLLFAAIGGNLDVVATLLSSGHANPVLGDKFGRNPVSEAAFRGHWEVVECLLQAGATVPAQSTDGVTPVHLAAEHGQSGCLEKLQVAMGKGWKEVVDLPGTRGFTPLMNAARNGHVECVQILLRLGANPNVKTNNAINILLGLRGISTALHCAIYGDHAECIELLLDKTDLRRLVHRADRIFADHMCPLNAAVKRRNHDLLKRLLSLGFPVNNVHKISIWETMRLCYRPYFYTGSLPEYESSLSHAAAVNDMDSLMILLDYGASTNPVLYDTVDKNGIRRKLSYPPVLSALCNKSWKALHVLLEHGSDVNCQPDGICPSVCLLLSFCNLDSTKKLLAHGSDPHLIFQQGNNKYQTILRHLGRVFNDISYEAFFQVLELLLQFVVISQPVRLFLYDIFELCHQLKPNLCVDECYKERWKAILQQVDKPSSLGNLCRIKIRQVMISMHGCSSFRAAIRRLCLPDLLKEYLLYSEINE